MFKKKDLMAELVDYLKKNLRKGYTKESLKWALLDQGYSKFEVERALRRADKELADQAPILKTRPKIKYEVVEPNPGEENKDVKTKKGIFSFFRR